MLYNSFFFEEQYSLEIETLHIAQQLCQKNTFLLKMINIDLEDLYNRLKKQYLYKQGEISDQERILDLQERLIKENGDVCSRMVLRYYLANVYIHMQQFQQALSQYEMIQRLAPDLIVTHRLKDRLEIYDET